MARLREHPNDICSRSPLKVYENIAMKPGKVRKIKVYLIDPQRFVIQWKTPKTMGNPLPLHYDIIINHHRFKKAVTQHKAPTEDTNTFAILVFNCDPNELYKVGIDSYNDKIKGKQSKLCNIKTIIKPSVIRDLQINNGIASWNPPIYSSFGALKYELIDADDIEEKTIASTESSQINLNPYYKRDLKWRIRIKETKYGNHSFSPPFGYNIGAVRCTQFTAAEVFNGNIDTFNTSAIKYPKWSVPPEPDILKDITKIELMDKGSYLLVPSELDPNTNDNVLSVICFSDTHTKHKQFAFDTLPSADILIHAGDFTFDGNKSQVLAFEEWGKFITNLNKDESNNTQIYDAYYSENGEYKVDDLEMEQRKYKHLICIAGNHEMTFDVKWYNEHGSDAKRYHKYIKPSPNAQEIKDIIIHSDYWTYLEDSTIRLYGLNIYGSPWQPYFYNWAFQKSRGKELDQKWKRIPHDTDILLTHGGPYCHGDKVSLDRVKTTGDNKEYVGDKMLMNRIQEIGNIKYHVFGHIHDGNGCSQQKGIKTTFINAASLNGGYYPANKPIVFYIKKNTQ